ncbi:MAG TPA: endolytic transglycosylase MltG [Candidatus Paceibacterota bacterium]|nr:endolytic transglycosylase MltG [Candidatus Paceibacterota bacterium]
MSVPTLRRRFTPRRIAFGFLAFLFVALLGYAYLFGPVDDSALSQEFLVAPGTSVSDVANRLEDEGFIRSSFAFNAAYRGGGNERIRPGGYRISRAMDTLAIADMLARTPSIAWVTVTPGMRKEEIAELLGEHLTWTEEEKREWIDVHTAPSPSFVEGVYYPDTYLIPTDQSPKEVAERMRKRFQEVFAPYANEAAEKGMDWTDVVNLASLVQREAAKNDKALVAAILWNRIDRDMLLQVDATLQYVRGNKEKWWPVPQSEDKYLESPFNTYQNTGLPPHPIANPSLDSIRAVLNPDQTDCLYYLHDYDGQIHCSTNYAQHKANVETYLR